MPSTSPCCCWACTAWPPPYKRHDLDWRMHVYEEMVEYVETGVEFSISSLWRSQTNHWHGTLGIARNVVHDMHLHGLLTCLKQDHPSRYFKCRLWVVRDDTSVGRVGSVTPSQPLNHISTRG